MEQNQPKPKSNDSKANRILFAVIVSVLCVAALVAGLVSSFSRDDPQPSDTTPQVTTPGTDNPDDKPDAAKTFVAPCTGSVVRNHDLTTFVFSDTLGEYRVHRGIDISAALGDAVVAVCDGVVTEIRSDPMMGKTVVIDHGDGIVSIYQNLNETLAEGLSEGSKVSAGDVIGAVGETALMELADEPHLHFEMTDAGESVDPLSYISEESQSASLGADTSYEG